MANNLQLKEKEKCILVDATLSGKRNEGYSIVELKGLCDTAGCECVGKLTQNIKDVNPATFIGQGKLEQLCEMIKQLDAEIIIFNNELTGSQIRNISDATGVKVIDRTMLILDIFAQRATTNEGKLQVQLAQLKYTLPRLSGVSNSVGKFGGGVGMRGPGETKLEIDKRRIQSTIQRLEKDIEQINKSRDNSNKLRKTSDIKKVAIVGYTNAGKSTLLNALTKAFVYADDKLFATLETTSRKLWLGEDKTIIITDTVGFIDKLPHAFVSAFKSTLDEARQADLLLVVCDMMDENILIQKEVINKVLSEIGASDIKKLYVYNKMDKGQAGIEMEENSISISAKNKLNLTELKELIIKNLF